MLSGFGSLLAPDLPLVSPLPGNGGMLPIPATRYQAPEARRQGFTHAHTMKKWLSGLALLLVVALGGGYLYLSRQGLDVRITEAEIRQQVNAHMPIVQHYMVIVRLTLNNPRIALDAERQRVTAGLDANLNFALGNTRPITGQVDISGQVRYVPERGQFFLANAEVERFEMPKLPAKYRTVTRETLRASIKEYFGKTPLYTLDESDRRQQAAKMLLKSITVGENALVAHFGL